MLPQEKNLTIETLLTNFEILKIQYTTKVYQRLNLKFANLS